MVAAGVLVTLTGYYTPFLIASSVITTVGAGLLSTLYPSSALSSCLGYQVVLSVGIGLGLQNAMLVPQVTVAAENVIQATALLWFVQTLSSSIVLSVAESVFNNRLVENLRISAPLVNPLDVGKTASRLQDNVPSEYLGDVLGAYSRAITQTFYIGVAMCALSIAGSASLQWLSVRQDVVDGDSDGDDVQTRLGMEDRKESKVDRGDAC